MATGFYLNSADNLAEQISYVLADDIIKLKLKPGERILEAKIAKSFGVSRAPVREALRILEKKGLVDIFQRRGARVKEFTVQYVQWLYEILFELYSLVVHK